MKIAKTENRPLSFYEKQEQMKSEFDKVIVATDGKHNTYVVAFSDKITGRGKNKGKKNLIVEQIISSNYPGYLDKIQTTTIKVGGILDVNTVPDWIKKELQIDEEQENFSDTAKTFRKAA